MRKMIAAESGRPPACACPPGPRGMETFTKRLLAVPKAEFDKAMEADRQHKQGRKVG